MKLTTLTILATTALIPISTYAQDQDRPGTRPTQMQANQNLRPIAVSQLKGETVYSQQDQEIGEIERVVLGQGNQAHVVVSFGEFLGLGGEERMIPLSRIAYRGDRLVVQGMREAEFRNLQTYQTDMAGYREAEPNAEARILVLATASPQNQAGQNQAQTAQDGSRIFVQQSAPTVRVNPADPRVVVRQAQPQVTVNQAQPEIIVRQPQPTVRVDIPQPEIIVRMPEPDVNVTMAQPQVQVTQPRPQVQVTRPQQEPQVHVERAQPQVLVQRQAGEEAQVQVQRAEGAPQVRYERAEPRVIVNQADGQPNVRIERQNQTQAQNQAETTRQAAANRMSEQDRQRPAEAGADALATARERLGVGDVDTTAAVGTAATRALTIRELEDMDVYNARGEELGEIDRVILNPANNTRYAVLEHGGFLGLGEEQVALPLERFWLRGDRLVIRGVTEEDLEAMPDWERRFANYREMEDNARTALSVWE